MASADLRLHPVRLPIIRAFVGDRILTAGQLAAEPARPSLWQASAGRPGNPEVTVMSRKALGVVLIAACAGREVVARHCKVSTHTGANA